MCDSLSLEATNGSNTLSIRSLDYRPGLTLLPFVVPGKNCRLNIIIMIIIMIINKPVDVETLNEATNVDNVF